MRTIYMIGIVIALFVGIAVLSAQCQELDALDPTETSILISANGQNSDRIIAVAASTPIEAINGFANGYISQMVADGMVTSEIMYGRVQGAYDFANDMSLEAFYEVTRDKWRGISLQNRIGWFYRPGVAEVGSILISGGLGTFSQNQELLEEIGKDQAGESTVEFGPLLFATAKWKNVIGKVQTTPDFGLEDWEIEGSATIGQNLTDTIEVGLTGKILYDQGSVVEDTVHREYLGYIKIVM